MVCYYRDDDGDSGYGSNKELAVWIGSPVNAPETPPESWWNKIDDQVDDLNDPFNAQFF